MIRSAKIFRSLVVGHIKAALGGGMLDTAMAETAAHGLVKWVRDESDEREHVMIQLPVAEAQAGLPEVLARVKLGETVEIHPDSGELYLLVTMPKNDRGAPAWPGYPKAGSLKGKIWMSEDFDEPLEELREYME